jgi:hypothetical protein
VRRSVRLALGVAISWIALAACGRLGAPNGPTPVAASMQSCIATVPEPEAEASTCVSIDVTYVPSGEATMP